MTEQNDLFSKNGSQNDAEQAEEPGTDKQPELTSFPEEEVRPVPPSPPRRSSNRILVLLLLLVVLIGAGYYLLKDPKRHPPGKASLVTVPLKLPVPARPEAGAKPEVTLDEQKDAAPGPDNSKPLPENPAETSGQPGEASQITHEAQREKALPKSHAAVAPTVEEPRTDLAGDKAPVAPKEEKEIYSVMVGPFLTKKTLHEAVERLQEFGFDPQQVEGRGMVEMTRLLEGVYPAAEAKQRLEQLKLKVGEAFQLPSGNKRKIFLGSFSDPERAQQYADDLAKRGINVSLEKANLEMTGKMLVPIQADRATARQLADKIGKTGLHVQVLHDE